MLIKSSVPEGFAHATALPSSAEQQQLWQEANRAWWQRNPMRYDWSQGIGYSEFTRHFYEEIDRRFFSDAFEYIPWATIPFDRFIKFEELRGKDVLEIGVGSGSHAGLLARYARSFTGIDITD